MTVFSSIVINDLVELVLWDDFKGNSKKNGFPLFFKTTSLLSSFHYDLICFLVLSYQLWEYEIISLLGIVYLVL